MAKQFDVCIPTKWENNGDSGTNFWRVGRAWLNDKDGKVSISVQIGPNVIAKELVLFPVDKDKQSDITPDDDTPF